MSNPHVQQPDPDALVPPEYSHIWAEGYAAGWEDAPRPAPRRHPGLIVGLILGIVVGLLTGFRLASAAPRTAAQPVIPAVWFDQETVTSGNLAQQPSGAPPAVVTGHPRPSATPEPTGGIASAIQAGVASWCAPTPTHCQRWGGNAHVGAVPSFRYGDRPYQVVVRYRGRSTIVTVVSYCGCPARIIDLSPAAFRELAPLSRGIIEVKLEELGARATPPATDTEAAP